MFTREFDDHFIGQAHDLSTAAAVAPVHAIVIRAGGFGDGDLAVLDGDLVCAIGGAYRYGGIPVQGEGLDQLPVGPYFCHLGIPGPQQPHAQYQAEHQHCP